jgi:hypothetical protein
MVSCGGNITLFVIRQTTLFNQQYRSLNQRIKLKYYTVEILKYMLVTKKSSVPFQLKMPLHFFSPQSQRRILICVHMDIHRPHATLLRAPLIGLIFHLRLWLMQKLCQTPLFQMASPVKCFSKMN